MCQEFIFKNKEKEEVGEEEEKKNENGFKNLENRNFFHVILLRTTGPTLHFLMSLFQSKT